MFILYLIGLIIFSPILFLLFKKGKIALFLKEAYEDDNYNSDDNKILFWVSLIFSCIFYPLFPFIYFGIFIIVKFYNFLDKLIK